MKNLAIILFAALFFIACGKDEEENDIAFVLDKIVITFYSEPGGTIDEWDEGGLADLYIEISNVNDEIIKTTDVIFDADHENEHDFEINHSFKTFEERIVIVVKDKDDDDFEVLSSLSISGGTIYNQTGSSLNFDTKTDFRFEFH